MTSQLNVDTIVDKAGSGGTNVKIGNTSTYVSDGGAVTQNTVQGIAKSWFKFNQDTPAISDSFNISSIADDGTGSHRGLFTNNMSNANFANTAMKQAESTNADCTEYTTGSNSTSQVERKDVENNAVRDAANTNTLTFGDLA